jgi:threonine dehydrogenase-like Zn-dependent dehydrogenase
MKALIKNNTGISISNLDLTVKENWVLLKVNTIGLCRTDLLVASGVISVNQESIILGHEFSATVENDPLNIFTKGQIVGVNPLWNNKFMGLDFDGAICEFIYVPHDKVIPTTLTDFKVIAYLEPVAASMAVLKAINKKTDKKVAIVGNNRISQLTKLILDTELIDCEILNEKELTQENEYDVIIETVLNNDIFSAIIKALKPEKTLIIKSRKREPVNFQAVDLIAKEINIRSVNYYDFNKAMRWLENNYLLIQSLLGEAFPLTLWENAFAKANSGEQQKIFIKI